MRFETRATWENVAGNQTAEPLRIYEPESLEQLVEIVREAEKHAVQVRAIGSGHSWSDVTVTSGFLVKPDGLNKTISLDSSVLNDGVNSDTLCHVESGMRIRELNEELRQRELALPNMGGYDAQTFVGAMSTSTHGSGIQFGPFSDFVESIELVSDEGVVYRIEPTQGITDRAKYEAKYPGKKLVQEDDWFHAVVVSMGCMGIIYSIILRVQEKFWLTEVRQLSTWDKVKEDLRQGDVFEKNRHYEVLLNPYEVDGEHRCLITTRNPTTPPQDKPVDKLNRNFLTEFIAGLPFIRRILNAVVGTLPDITPELINSAMEGLVDDEYSNISYKVFNIGVANEVGAYSAEIGFPIEKDRYISAIDRILELAREYESLGEVYLTSPMSLRFVKGSKAFLSPQYGYDTCMLEIIVVKDTQGSFEMMSRFENEMYDFSGRPHWGQVNTLTGSHNLVESMYPEYGKWLDVYHQLNKNGTFDSPFSKRVGFRKETFEANI
jgi:hypothetical protein